MQIRITNENENEVQKRIKDVKFLEDITMILNDSTQNVDDDETDDEGEWFLKSLYIF